MNLKIYKYPKRENYDFKTSCIDGAGGVGGQKWGRTVIFSGFFILVMLLGFFWPAQILCFAKTRGEDDFLGCYHFSL